MVSIFLYAFFLFEPDNFFGIVLKCLAERCGINICCKQSMLLQGLLLPDCCHRGVQCAPVPRKDSRHKGVSSCKECPSPFSPDAARLCVSHIGIHFAFDIAVYSIEQCASYIILRVFMSFISRPHGSPTHCLVRADSARAGRLLSPMPKSSLALH